jgi:glycosyltransferase involved in cell wall biosynthesis
MNATIVASELLEAEFELEIIPMRSAESIEDVGRLSLAKISRVTSTVRELMAAVRRMRPDLVYMTFATSPPAFYRDLAVGTLLTTLGARVVYHMHTKGTSLQPWQRSLLRRAFRDASVIHLSPALAHEFAQLARPRSIKAVENGVGDRHTPRTKDRNGVVRILFLSNMREDKGPLILLAALAKLASTNLTFEATFAGARDSEACAAAFEAAVRDLGLGARVRWVGPAYGDAKDELFRTHDIFAFPTMNDAFPLVLIEAMMWELPIVTTNEGAIPEMLGESGAGTIVPKGDPAQLADELARLIASPDVRHEMADRARRRYLDQFTGAHFERRLAAAWRELLSN